MYTELQKEIIDGIIISDGYCTQVGGLDISQQTDHLDILELLVDKLEVRNNCSLNSRERHDNRTNKIYYCSELRLHKNDYLVALRNTWYPSGKKVIPSIFKITPITLLYWYVFDGHVTKDTTAAITLSTDSFSENEINFLINQFIHLGFNPFKTTQNKLKFKIDDIFKFYNFIGTTPICESYAYKWISPEKMKRKTTSADTQKYIWEQRQKGIIAKVIAEELGMNISTIYYSEKAHAKRLNANDLQ